MLTKENMDDPRMQPFREMQDILPGMTLFIRADPWHYIGEVVGVGVSYYQLAPGAVWVAESGSFEALQKTGRPEQFSVLLQGVFVNRAAICDMQPWAHPIPKGGNV